MALKLQFQRRFSMAHRLLSGKAKKCAVIHGHNEIITVDIISKNKVALDAKSNMVCEFEAVKKRWHQFVDNVLDHAFQISEKDPLLAYFQQNEPHCLPRLLVTPGDPTTEILCACLMNKLQVFLNQQGLNLYCEQIAIQETPTNTVILEGIEAYRSLLLDEPRWWNKADFSINDLEISNHNIQESGSLSQML